MINALSICVFAIVFYWGFAASISIYRLWLQGKLNTLNKVLYAPLLGVFLLLDILINWTLLVFIMGEPPDNCLTISTRFEYYHHGAYGWKTTVATFVCERLLNTVDPTGNHC
jgi:hypothetical protein